jgi:hypothetical protein
MDSVVVFDERGLEQLVPHAVDLAKTFTDQTEEFVVGAFLGATLDNHRR